MVYRKSSRIFFQTNQHTWNETWFDKKHSKNNSKILFQIFKEPNAVVGVCFERPFLVWRSSYGRLSGSFAFCCNSLTLLLFPPPTHYPLEMLTQNSLFLSLSLNIWPDPLRKITIHTNGKMLEKSVKVVRFKIYLVLVSNWENSK